MMRGGGTAETRAAGTTETPRCGALSPNRRLLPAGCDVLYLPSYSPDFNPD